MNDIQNEFKEVIESYTETLERDPQNIEAYLGRGMAKIAIEDYNGAIVDFTEALRLNPEDSETYIKIGNAKHYLGDYYRAISEILQRFN